jgi:uncharacterized protein DUF4234
MAEIVTIEGQQFKKRSPWGAWGLVFLTIGVYFFVWYYKINDEARRYLRDDTIKPVLSVLAMFVPIVNFVSIYRTGDRIVRMENNVGIQKSVEPILGLVAAYIAALHIPYYQSHLNKVWELYQGGGAPPAPMAPSGQPASIPPPPPQ